MPPDPAKPPLRPNYAAEPGTVEFTTQADTYTLDGARGVLRSLQAKRRSMTAPIDQEIAFVEKVITYKETNS